MTKNNLTEVYKPLDVVTDKDGNVGIIQETDLYDNYSVPDYPQYSVKWIVGTQTKHAWFDHDELVKHTNLYRVFAEMMAHPMTGSSRDVERIINSGGI